MRQLPRSRVALASHRTRGLYRLFESAGVYEAFQRALGARGSRDRWVRDFVRPTPGMRILDIGCGPAAVLDHLPTSVTYVGYDLNERYIEQARRRHGDRGTFHCADAVSAAETLEITGRYDLVLVTALLHHMDDAAVNRLAEGAARLIRPGGVLVTLDCVLHPGQPRVARWLARLDRGARVRTPEAYRALIEPHFAAVESSLMTDLLPIPYSHLLMRATTAGGG